MFVNGEEMVISDFPIDLLGATCLSADGLQVLVVILVVVVVGEPADYVVEVAGHGDGSQLGGRHCLHRGCGFYCRLCCCIRR